MAKTQANTKTKTSKKSASRVARPQKINSNVHKSLHRLHILSGILFLLLAVAAGVVMKASPYQINIGYMAKDELASRTTTVFTPATRSFYDMDIRWLVVGLLVFSAIVSLLTITKFHERYHTMLKNRVQSLRWLDGAVSGVLTVGIIGLLGGIHDLFVLKLMGIMVIIAAFLAWFSERQNNVGNKAVWSPFLVGIFTCLSVWWVIGSTLLSTYIYGFVRLPWYAYAAAGVAFLSFSLLALNHFYYLKRLKGWADYLRVERNYLLLNLVGKASLAAVVIIGLK